MKKYAYLIGLVLLAASSATTRAQKEITPNQEADRVVTATNLVTVNVVVTDRDGRYVKGLTREQFEVYDEKVKQLITHFSTTAAPVSIGIVCEIRNATPERTRAMLTALRQFTHSLREDDDFFFMGFGKSGSVTTDFVPNEQILNHLTSATAGGPAALFDAVYAAADRLSRGRHLKKALLIVSDGEDENSRTNYTEVRNRLSEFDVQIYTIGIANSSTDQFAGYGRWVFEDLTRQTGRRPFLVNTEASMGRAVLAEMARVSGGSYFPESENEPELVGVCAQIALELREQYTIAFYPTEHAEHKDWRRIRVQVKAGKNYRALKLSYRRGYRRGN